jgi:parallel beta-helix repeat protein
MQKTLQLTKQGVLVIIILFTLTPSSYFLCPANTINIYSFNLETSQCTNTTIYVDDDNTQGPWDGTLEHPFQRIQDGINHSQDSDTVYVFSGVYYEHVWVNKTISLIGEDRNTTIIDANHSGVCAFLVSGHVHVTGFTMQNSGTAWYNDAGVGIKNLGHDSHGNIIEGNIMQHNYYGVFAWGSDYNVISNNIIRDNMNDGIYFQAADSYTTITNNSIIDNGINGIRMEETDSDHNVLRSNIIDNNSASGIIAYGDHCIIAGNHISRSKNGITVYGYATSIQNNNITQNHVGLTLVLAMQCVVEENTFITNLKDATFSYYLMQRVMLPLLLFPQITKWHANYWNQVLSGPKIIVGKMDFSLFLDVGIPWVNCDFSPAHRPYSDNTKEDTKR